MDKFSFSKNSSQISLIVISLLLKIYFRICVSKLYQLFIKSLRDTNCERNKITINNFNSLNQFN